MSARERGGSGGSVESPPPAVLAGAPATHEPWGVRTVVDALEVAWGDWGRGFTFYDQELVAQECSFAEVAREARRRGQYLRSLGLPRGARVGLVIAENSDFVLTFFGAISAGLVPVPMAPPLGPRQRGYLETVAGVLQASGAEALVTSEVFAPVLDSLRTAAPALREVVFAERMRTAALAFDERAELTRAAPDDVCFLQFTSGSTSRPKGVVVTHANLVANARAILLEGVRRDPHSDVALGWLPLYHDMGLIGFVCAPLIVGMSSVLFPTFAFMRRPSTWMQLLHEHRATITFAPNFAYGLVASRLKNAHELDLRRVRVVGCGAEPIMPDTLRAFAAALAPAGLRPEALMPAYGMAEHTLAVTFESPEEPLRTIVIDRETYEGDGLVRVLPEGSTRRALELVSCGKPFAGHSVAIMAATGALLPEGRVGEIVLRGPSATRGYHGDDEATKALCTDGWMHTGDLGFIHAGALYVSGRLKDVIIVNGRNYYPQDIEWELERISGLRRGGVVALGVRAGDTERIVVVAEVKGRSTPALREEVESRVAAATGARPADVVFVRQGTVPRTSSGKVQRRKTLALYERGALTVEAQPVEAAEAPAP